MTAKETVRALLDRWPDDCRLDDVLVNTSAPIGWEQETPASDGGRKAFSSGSPNS